MLKIEQMVPWIRNFNDWARPFYQSTFGVVCVHCHEQVAGHSLPLCPECATELPHLLRPLRLESPYLKEAWCMGPYRSPMGSLVRRGKYSSQLGIFEKLGERLAGAALDLPAIDAIISIPLPNNRLRNRGFNQSWVLANSVSKFLGLPQYHILYRVDGSEQAFKTLSERRELLTGRFEVRPHFELGFSPRRVLLVDDVITTGSTAESCALELLNLGVQEVSVLALVSGR
jgi:ComF family protein